MPKITLLLGRKTMQVYDLDQATIRVGREEDMDILIDNPSVSRRQAEIRRESGGWVVEDLGQDGDPLAVARIQTLDNAEVAVGDLALSADARQLAVVCDRDGTITRAVQIDLDHVRALLHGQLIGG